MSKIDYQALREAAEKATCGEWSLEYGEGRFDGDDALIHREVVGYLPICRIEGAHPESGFDEDFQMEQQANAEFIAAASPATVLALLDELEAAEKRIAELESLTAPRLTQQAVPDEMPEPDTTRMFFTDAVVAIAKAQGWNACRAAMLHGAEPVSEHDELPLDYLQGHKDGLEWAAQLAEANHPQTGDWLYDDPIDLARAIRKGPDMPTVQAGNSPVTPDGWVMVPKEPTQAMIKAWLSEIANFRGHAAGYRAAIEAAPQLEVNRG
ncbi:ead/Ea22-like family protein [Escherichia coli]|uniref:ead/Ea22-like family protein n=1 Tax=Escherichia coli TaxID=562 RepID=UPI0005794563|nr:ead/Ea22-like family protein [Escherichia coli]